MTTPSGCGSCGTIDAIRQALSIAGNRAWSVSHALGRFVKEPSFVDAPTYAARLESCDRCAQRTRWTCRACGCFVALKARLPAEDCPLLRWGSESQTR